MQIQNWKKGILTEAILAFEFSLVLVAALRILAEVFFRMTTGGDKKSKFLLEGDSKRWFYASYLNSSIYSLYMCYIVYLSFISCEMPDQNKPSPGGSWPEHNMLTSVYCRDHPTEIMMRSNAVAMSILLSDLVVQIIFVRDFTSSAAVQNYLHHFLSIVGAASGIFFGRFYGTVSNVTMVTEVTTTFVNIRWILYYHELTDSNFYFCNGLVLMGTFFLARVCFMSYMVFMVVIPASLYTDFSKDPELVTTLAHFSSFCYLVLYGLNLFWFRKIVLGALKQI